MSFTRLRGEGQMGYSPEFDSPAQAYLWAVDQKWETTDQERLFLNAQKIERWLTSKKQGSRVFWHFVARI